MRIFLIGYMASGKSKTGEQLASLLGYPLEDTDTAIVKSEGKSIVEIFSESGEDAFRQMERNALLATFKKKNIVVSTGGGLPCSGDNMQRMNEQGVTVYLEANAGLLFHRLLQSRKGRPLLENLSDVELMEKINAHLAERTPYYEQAKLKVPAASLNVKKLAAQIQSL